MKINSIQNIAVSHKGLNLFGKIKSLVTKPTKDTFVKSSVSDAQNQKYSTPSVKPPITSVRENVAENSASKVVQSEKKTVTVSPSEKNSVSQSVVEETRKLSAEELEKVQIIARERSFEEYFKDYFQKVHLQKSTDGYCKLLEERLLKSGVRVTFENDAFTAKKIYAAIVEMQHRGIKVPHEVILMTPIDDDLLGFTPITKEGYEEFAPIFIKKGIRDDNDRLSKTMKEMGFRHYIDETARGTFIHELGHYHHLPLALSEQESMQIWKNHFPNFEAEFEFGKKVSAHAITDKTGAEFVAEVFNGLVNGETFDEEVMSLYAELKGPSVPQKSNN